MTQPTLAHVLCPDTRGTHRMAYAQWGDAAAPHVVVCVHGLSRQGRDFDVLAQALLARAAAQARPLRVVCPDVVGRGLSDWLTEPMDYQFSTYLSDMQVLLNALHAQAPVHRLDWVGTSMGGLMGLMLAGLTDTALPAPMRRLVLNDVGPVVQWQALQRIGQFLGQSGSFDSVAQAADYLRQISAAFGPHSDAQWLALARPMLHPTPDGRWRMHYDPAIAVPFAALTPQAMAESEAALWQLYERVQADTLLLRGAESDLLSHDTAQAMHTRGPRPRVVEFAGVGHAPTLVVPEQVAEVLNFLLPSPPQPPQAA